MKWAGCRSVCIGIRTELYEMATSIHGYHIINILDICERVQCGRQVQSTHCRTPSKKDPQVFEEGYSVHSTWGGNMHFIYGANLLNVDAHKHKDA